MRYALGRKKGSNPHFQIERFVPKHGVLPLSLSDETWAPPVYDQGQYPDCVGNAIASLQALYHNKRKKELIWPSRAAIYSQAKASFESTDEQLDGLSIQDGLLVPMRFGYVPESSFKYPTDPTGTDPGNLLAPVPENLWNTSFDQAGYLTIDPSNPMNLKYALSEHGAICTGLTYPSGWMNIGSDGYCDPKKAGDAAGGHCVYVLAFDDDKFGGSFRVRNSWGNSFGANGDFFIPYSAWEVCPQYVFDEAYIVRYVEPTT